VRNNQPADNEIEEKYRIDGQRFSARRLCAGQERHRRVRGPHETDESDGKAKNEEQSALFGSERQHLAQNRRSTRRQQTVSQHAQRLEERNRSAEQLDVQGYHTGAEKRQSEYFSEMGTLRSFRALQ